MALSGRKRQEIKQKKKEVAKAMKKSLDAIIAKMDRGESLRDEEQRSLRFLLKNWEIVEQSVAETKEETLPEGKLKEYVERLWTLKEIGELKEVVEYTGYYRCESCNELHPKDRKCMYEEFKEIKVDMELDKEDKD